MLSLEVREFAKKLNQLSLEDKQWLLQQLSQQIDSSGIINFSQTHDLEKTKKTFNLTPSSSGSGYNNTAINHDQILANSISGIFKTPDF
jgi:hypothetical protein